MLDPPTLTGTALAEAIAASLYSRLAGGEKAEISSTTTLFAVAIARIVVIPVRLSAATYHGAAARAKQNLA